MALIDLWKERVGSHDFNSKNLTAVNSDNYAPHNSPSRPTAPPEGVKPLTLLNIDEVDKQYFKDQNIPTAETDKIMKSRNLITKTFGTKDFDGANSIIEDSNAETGYIHHFTGRNATPAGGFVQGFFRDNTGIRYDDTAAKNSYDKSPATTASTVASTVLSTSTSVSENNVQLKTAKKNFTKPTPLSYDDWVTAQGQLIQNYRNPRNQYDAYVIAFGYQNS